MAQTRIKGRQIAFKGRIHGPIGNEARRVAHNGFDMIEANFAGAMREKHELFELRARREPVLAELGDKISPGIRGDRQAGFGHLGVDQLRDVPGGIGIALDCRRVFAAFAKRPQRRIFFQGAGLDDDRAVARRRVRQEAARAHW